MKFGTDKSVRFIQESHQYFNQENEEYKSVTRVIHSVQKPFNSKDVSRRMAISKIKGNGESVTDEKIKQQQTAILDQWESWREDSSNHGTRIHNAMEDFVISGKINDKLIAPINYVRMILKESYRAYPEEIIFSHKYKVAGQADLVIQRRKSNDAVFDFYDYKTNKRNGILFDSIMRKGEKITHYNKFLLPPLNHLEDCNYVIYALQLSIYALMAQINYGIKIGRLGIIFIDQEFRVYYYPVPFMALEARELLEYRLNAKQLPVEKKMVNQNSWED